MFAPKYHSAMKNVATVRKELKKRTVSGGKKTNFTAYGSMYIQETYNHN